MANKSLALKNMARGTNLRASDWSHQATALTGGRLHLNEGPIDLILWADGDEPEVAAAFIQACDRFDGLLEDLVAELTQLRSPVRPGQPALTGSTAQRMRRAIDSYGDIFVTPMAAVAGAVADEILAAMTAGRDLRRAYVNNGGDIALHLNADETLSIGAVSSLEDAVPDGMLRIAGTQSIRGIATSGMDGRSFSVRSAYRCEK